MNQVLHIDNWTERKGSVLDEIRHYQSFLKIKYETSDFLIKTADDGQELKRALELRHEVFVEEWRGLNTESGLDLDDYDFLGDHLLIIENKTNDVIGTYRLICSKFSNKFYSESEFVLDSFLNWPGIKLELGRACIRLDHRNGNTIDLLWKGLATYINSCGARYLFGCASVRETDPRAVGRLMAYLHSKSGWNRDHQIWPVPDYQLPDFSVANTTPLSPVEAKQMIPPLLRTYLHAGAEVFGYPALDRDFSCVDIFTVLDMTQIDLRFRERYFSRHAVVV